MEAAHTARVVCFWLAGQEFAVPIRHVKETIVLRPITRVFLTPDWMAGIINLRGEVVAVIDLPSFFGLGRCELGTNARIIIAQAEGDHRKRSGFLVDRLGEVKRVDLAPLQAPTMLASEHVAMSQGMLTGERGAPLTILDMPRIFESERLREFQRKA